MQLVLEVLFGNSSAGCLFLWVRKMMVVIMELRNLDKESSQFKSLELSLERNVMRIIRGQNSVIDVWIIALSSSMLTCNHHPIMTCISTLIQAQRRGDATYPACYVGPANCNHSSCHSGRNSPHVFASDVQKESKNYLVHLNEVCFPSVSHQLFPVYGNFILSMVS